MQPLGDGLAMIFFVLLLVLVLILAIGASTLAMRGGKRYSWMEFYLKAREAGLSFSEGRQLRDAATLSGLGDPTNVLWSPRDMDRSIAILLTRLKEEGRDRTREGIVLVDKIYALRKSLEFEQPRFKYGIKSSRHIAQGQRVRVLVYGIGVYNATVLDNNARFLVISYPTGGRLPKGWVWQGKRVSMYFWRHDDAGYVFDSFVIDDLRIRNVPVLHVSHSEALLRTQKRRSVRARSRIPAYLYILKRIEGAYEKPERAPGLRAQVQDLSEDGVAVAIGGKAIPGLKVKLQFGLGERSIVMSGTVKSVDYDAEKNRSVIHVEAVTPSPRTRNAIRSYVYGIGAEQGVSSPADAEPDGAAGLDAATAR
jgi:c-di-GMP-binding flagellar brake protein YcgR